MKERFVRVGDELVDDITVVVRGGILVAAVLADDAMRNHAVYGVYGISVFAAKGVTVDELAQVSPLVRFEALTLMTAGAIRQSGLVIEPTGRNSLHYDVTFRDLTTGIESLLGCANTVFHNPYFED